jgi:putative DNA primase/helicase
MSTLLTATGNNLILQGDLPRRSLRCEIDAKTERPELRVFPGANIQSVFRQRRGELVMALLTVLRAYQVSNATASHTVSALGGFEMWSAWVRDALIWLGCEDPCNTIETIRIGNPEREQHEAAVLAWRDHPKLGLNKVVKVRDLTDAADLFTTSPPPPATQQLHDALHAVAADTRRRDSISHERLGRWLRKVNGKFEQGLRIARVGSIHGYPTWWLTS